MLGRNAILAGSLVLATLGVVGPAGPNKSLQAAAKKLESYPMVGDETGIDGLFPVKVEGIGLVVGLPHTGSDPPPNGFRDYMLEQMQKRGVHNPNEILASDTTSIVLLRAFVPPGARKGDIVDVEVWVPPGDSTTSLKSGRLLKASLYESVIAKDKFNLKGKEIIRVEGPVLVTPGPNDSKDSASLRKGKILGQGICLVDRDFRMILDRDRKSVRRTKEIAYRVNQRFFVSQGVASEGLAKPKDDKTVELKVSKQYRFDIERYLLVARKIPRSNSDSFYSRIMPELKEDLLDPQTTLEAALRLEAIGPRSTPTLKEGLKSEYEVVRFASAMALAYLRDGTGVEELRRLAENSGIYRSYALGGLVALDQPISRVHLSGLLGSRSAEARYGAFRALWVHDHEDPQVRGERLNDEFWLHVIRTRAEPMVHVSRAFRPEIVVFNEIQQLKAPFSLRAGEFILINAGPEGERVHLASVRAGQGGAVRKRAESSLSLVDVIQNATKLGATYSDVVDLLKQAAEKGCLMGRLEVNALPQSPPLETLAAMTGAEPPSGRPNGRVGAPTLFSISEGDGRRVPGEPLAGGPAEKPDSAKTVDEKKTKRSFNIFRWMSN